MLLQLVTLVVALAFVGASQYEVPEPNIECFSPKGLRVSIPDTTDIKSVQFFLSFNRPVVDNDPGTVSKEIDDKQGSYWIYWNPSVQLTLNDVVNYKLMVNKRDLYWSKEGSHTIDKVISLTDNTVVTAVDCEDDAGQQQVAAFPNLDHIEDKNLALTGGQKNNLKSSYSMFKTVDAKPITRTSTTTTSGTYYIKPTGDVEGTGYKTASSYDSTRRDGEQWQHSKSDLSTTDIEELKRIHGQDFMSLPGFSGMNIHSGGSGGSYRSYSSSSGSSHMKPAFGSSSSYFQSGQTADMLPVVRPAGYKYSEYEEHHSSQANPQVLIPAAKYSSSDINLIHTPVVLPESVLGHPGFGQVAASPPSGYSTVQTNYHRKETVKSTAPVVTTYPAGGSSVQRETYEFSSKPKTIVPQPLSLTETTIYQGDIFRSSVRPTSPSSCQVADYGYKTAAQIDVVELERSLQQVQCLAVLAERSLKAEVQSLKQANGNLMGRLQDLEEQFRRFRNECKCDGY